MKFYNKVNENEILWDSTGKNKICEFVKGECEILDIKIAERLIKLKQISYNKQEFDRFKEGVKMGLCGFNRARREEAEKKKSEEVKNAKVEKVTELMQDNVIEEKEIKKDKSEKIKEEVKVEEIEKDTKSTIKKSKDKKVDDK